MAREEIGDVLGENVGVERRLLRHADLLPQRAVVGDHRLAEDRLQAVEILDVVVGLGDQHALEMLGLGEQHDALVGQVDGNDAAVALRHLHQDGQGIVGHLEQRRQLEPDGGFLAQLVDVGNGCGHLDGLRRRWLMRHGAQQLALDRNAARVLPAVSPVTIRRRNRALSTSTLKRLVTPRLRSLSRFDRPRRDFLPGVCGTAYQSADGAGEIRRSCWLTEACSTTRPPSSTASPGRDQPQGEGIELVLGRQDPVGQRLGACRRAAPAPPPGRRSAPHRAPA